MHRNHHSSVKYISPPSHGARAFIPKSDSCEAQAASKILLLKEERLLAEHEQMDKRFSAGSLASLCVTVYLGCRIMSVLARCDCLCVFGHFGSADLCARRCILALLVQQVLSRAVSS